ncbi:MAG: Trm112 family protein [Thermodesulfovibrionales bacterium]|nr:Trm112 family protein [Thermodesulfovibrionales bacterium]
MSKELLEILACPKCKGVLLLVEKSSFFEGQGLVCDRCRLLYPVREGIPVMLIDEASEL